VPAVLQFLLHLPSPVLLGTIGALVFSEAAFFLGFVVPGETAVLLGGFMSSTGRLPVALLAVVVVLAAVIGDSVGYEVGKRFGPRMLATRPFRGQQHRVAGARAFLDGRGASAVFIGRFTAFLRAVVPGLAGLTGMRYRRFFAFNAVGGLVWGAGCVAAGYLAGNSYERVAHWLGRGGALAAAVLAVAVLFAWHQHRRRA
jgi:membrane-associated protein